MSMTECFGLRQRTPIRIDVSAAPKGKEQFKTEKPCDSHPNNSPADNVRPALPTHNKQSTVEEHDAEFNQSIRKKHEVLEGELNLCIELV